MRKIIVLYTTLALLAATLAGCKKDDLPPNVAEGKIIFITGGCNLESVYIEVVNPKGIGVEGVFYPNHPEREVNLKYKNAINIPYFKKIGLPEELMQEGTYLKFKYRELTDEEQKKKLFSPSEFIICRFLYGPPPSRPYIITNIIEYKKP